MVIPATAKELKTLLESFSASRPSDLEQIAAIAKHYPYFQLAAALNAKAQQEQEKFEASTALNKAALLTANRSLLRELFTTTPKILDQKPAANKKTKTKKSKDKKETSPVTQKETPIKETPLKTTPQSMSFTAWIREMQNKQQPSDEGVSKWELIDRFIAANPSIGPVDKNAIPAANIEINNEFNSGALMTETLAQLFVQQKKYDEALKAYAILRLKYPEKNSFFADQIKAIKRLKKQD